jgi:hypothetical protein
MNAAALIAVLVLCTSHPEAPPSVVMERWDAILDAVPNEVIVRMGLYPDAEPLVVTGELAADIKHAFFDRSRWARRWPGKDGGLGGITPKSWMTCTIEVEGAPVEAAVETHCATVEVSSADGWCLASGGLEYLGTVALVKRISAAYAGFLASEADR